MPIRSAFIAVLFFALGPAARAAPTKAQLDCYRVCNQTIRDAQKRNSCLGSCTSGKGPAGSPKAQTQKGAGKAGALSPAAEAEKKRRQQWNEARRRCLDRCPDVSYPETCRRDCNDDRYLKNQWIPRLDPVLQEPERPAKRRRE